MKEAAAQYFDWCDENPLYAIEKTVVSGGKDAGSSVELTKVPRMRVYTMEGLCTWLSCNTAYFYQFEASLNSNNTLTKKEKADFSNAIKLIKEAIRRQKYEGAAAGFFKEGLITRDLGISDTVKNVNYDSVPLSREEMREIADEIDDDI